MISPTKKIIWNNAPLKVISFILGYSFWYIISNAHIATSWLTVPIYFYNVAAHKKVTAPENLMIKVAGKRCELRSLDTQTLAVHINAQEFCEGPNKIVVSNATLFLPDSIKLLHYCPSNITAELEQSSNIL